MEIKLPRTRKEAQLLLSKEYYTGKMCPHKHTATRRTDNGACTDCQAVYKRDLYGSGWRQIRNIDASNAATKRWCEMHPKQHWIIRAVSRAKKRAELTDVPFNITVTDIENIITDRCPIFGSEFKFIGNKTSKADSPSLDKVDPLKGYVVGNIEIISMKANVIKQNATSADIFKVAEWLKTKGY